MKQQWMILVSVMTAALLLGCGKKEEAPAPPALPKPAAQEMQKAVDSAKPAAQEMQKSVSDAATSATSQAQGLINQTKELIAKKDYQSAMNVINQLGTVKLTPEQEKMVADLKAQVQKYLTQQATEKTTGEATKALDGMLK